jgi:hypothetical protein
MKSFLLSNLFIVFLISCSETYIKVDKNTKIEDGKISEKSPTILYNYLLTKEARLEIKDELNVKTNYRIFFDDVKPILDVTKKSIDKNLKIVLKNDSIFSESKSIKSIEAIELEDFLFLTRAPLFSEKKHLKLVPDILKETNSEQMILAKVVYELKEIPKSDKSNLGVTVTVLIYDKRGKLIYAKDKIKWLETYLPDDDLSVANFLGDILSATVKGKINVKSNKHVIPQVVSTVESIWDEITLDIKKNLVK